MVNLQIIKSANTSYIFLAGSNKVIYSVLIINNGDTKATAVRVRDLLDGNARIIPSTVKVDGCDQNVLLKDMSISVGVIEPGGNSVVTYEVEISKNCVKKFLTNKALVSYSEFNGENNCQKFLEESNEVVLPIIDIDVQLKKIVDKSCAKIGEVLSYTMILRNNSNIDIKNVVLYDCLTPELELFPGAVYVNGCAQYLENLEEVDLGDINPYSSLVIQFKAKVLYMPNCGNIENSVSACFSYTVVENCFESTASGSVCSNKVITRISSDSTFCC